ncbi:MAG: ThuA domain-containing protein [Pirellulaceae bacterium]
MKTLLFSASLTLFVSSVLSAADPWVVYEGTDGPGKGKHIVLISGDEEYRSEEALPQLGKILARRHGFKCTVLFPIDPASGVINPDVSNIPGTEALATADLMIIATRFRDLPDDQMKPIVDFIESGKPIIGMRTATHAFNIKGGKKYAKYTWTNGDKEYEKGFGRQVLGETWVSHWGNHGSQSTRGIVAKGQEQHPILRGIKEGAIWGPTDVYEANPGGDSVPLVLGQIVAGMKFDDPPAKYEDGKQNRNEPMMPVAWTKTYKGAGGKTARIFCTTMGAATDLEAEGTRRMLVNSVYWTLGMEDKIAEKASVELVGEFKPTPFGFGKYVKGVKVESHVLK